MREGMDEYYSKMWDFAIKKNITKRTELITTSQISNSYSIIINPFGDSFPEQDINLHKTFYSMCEYVKNGGIFVVTGGAFFFSSKPNSFISTSMGVYKND